MSPLAFSSHAASAHRRRLAEIPERVIIYHAGTGRTTFLAMLKLTSLFIGAFFCFIAVPTYIKADKPPEETAGSWSTCQTRSRLVAHPS